MALDLKRLKEVNDRFKPFRQSLDDLVELIDAAVESEHLIQKTKNLVKSQEVELDRIQHESDRLKAEVQESAAVYTRQRDEHKDSIKSLVEEKRKLLDAMDTELKEHKERIKAEMEHASQVHQQNMVMLAAEQAKAKKLLESAQKSLAEMTDRVRLTLGL